MINGLKWMFKKIKMSNMNNNLEYTGLGKRKTSVAKVFLKLGTGMITVNNKSFDDFFKGINEEAEVIKKPFVLANLINAYDVNIQVKGGGMHHK